MKNRLLLVGAYLVCGAAFGQTLSMEYAKMEHFAPKQYICYKSLNPITIDGDIDTQEWQNVPWSDDLASIVDGSAGAPEFRSRVKLLWDERYLYVAAELGEPHLWATLTERESYLFNDNNFELFIDPDGDSHNYFEIEMNALGTEWDLLMLRPYRDSRKEGSPAIHNWTLRGMKTAVKRYGTLNDPSDKDLRWCVEMALPIEGLLEFGPTRKLTDGDQWRVNFARVEWNLLIDTLQDGSLAYKKKTEMRFEKELPVMPINLTWARQGAINMHMPEHWGVVQFSDLAPTAGCESFRADPDEPVKRALRELYYRQRQWLNGMGQPASSISDLQPESIVVEGILFDPQLYLAPSGYAEITAQGPSGAHWHINDQGRIWKK